jgi:hypothetical protein
MLHDAVSGLIGLLSGRPAFRIYGRANYEPDWYVIDVYATSRRDLSSRWPLWRGACTTWTANVIAVGQYFANQLLDEQSAAPASQERPVAVQGGRLRSGRQDIGPPTTSEILAHECGHTGQARRQGFWYWPAGAAYTRFGEGPHRWNRFENDASATGLFGGIVADPEPHFLVAKTSG